MRAPEDPRISRLQAGEYVNEAELLEQIARLRQVIRCLERDLEEAHAEIAVLKADRRAAAA